MSIVFPVVSVPHQLQLHKLGGLHGQEVEDVVPVVDCHPDDLVEVSDEVPDCFTPLAVDQAELVKRVPVQEGK